MSRNICIYLEFLTDAHKAQITAAAEKNGFTPCFFTLDQREAALDCLQGGAEILYAHDVELLRAAPKSLQWYACTYAGVDPYCKNDGIFQNPSCLLTNSNVYGVTIAEHALMVTLMLLRRMPEYEAIVAQRGWQNQLPIRSIRDGRFTILGTGDIGSTIARRLKALGAAEVLGVSRSGRAAEGFDRVYPISQLDGLLPETNFLLMALPGTAETIHLMDAKRFALLPQGAYVVNVGRGSAIDQAALVDALNSGHLGGAALDVMEVEPLPQDDPLWTAKNVILTPHISGNMTLDYTQKAAVGLFCRNLSHYAAGETLECLVDRAKGY